MTSKYIPTNEQKKYLSQENGKIILNACPGSGKTTTIVHKLAKLIPKYEELNKHAGVLCISFTNIAKDEILGKYQKLCNTNIVYPHLVCTIDHFINLYITLPFYHSLGESFVRPKIIEDASFLDKLHLMGRYTNKEGKILKHVPYYAPSTIEFEFNGTFSAKNGTKPKEGYVDSETFRKYCREIKIWQYKEGLLKTSDSVFFALKVLEKFPQIAKSLIQRFPHVIIDEAQDTSEIQHAIFNKLIEAGLKNIEFIGDPYQSLYEWRDAKPELFYEKYNNSDFDSHIFTECKRSSQIIVDTYCLLRKKSESSLQSTIEREELPIFIYRFSENEESKVIKKWQDEVEGRYKENHVLVRPNALKNKLLGKSDEQVKPWNSGLPYKILCSLQEFSNKDIKKAVSTFRKIIPIIEDIDGYHKKKERELEIKKDYIVNGKIVEILKKLPLFDLSLKEWTEKTEIILKEYFPKNAINFELKVGIWNKKYEISMSNIFFMAESEHNIKVSTVHGIKGKTFDSVLLFLGRSGTISIDDIVAKKDLSEKQKIIYVAMSRPRHLLAIAIPDHYSEEEIKMKLGDNVKFK